MQLSGKVLGNYRLHQQIGEGGYASVYLGIHRSTGKEAAIKVLDLQADESELAERVSRFSREIAIIQQMQHATIIPIYETGQTSRYVFIAMQYVQFGTIETLIKHYHDQPLPLSDTCTMLCQVLQALQSVHAKGIVHRDIKPANILIADPVTNRVFLTDFGIAKVMGEEGLTRVDMTVGTPAYMAPEQISFGGTITPQSDIYSLACVAYEMLTGRLPFPGNHLTLLNHHLSDTPTPIRTFNPQVPAPIALILERAMRKDPHERYATATILLVALSPFARPL